MRDCSFHVLMESAMDRTLAWHLGENVEARLGLCVCAAHIWLYYIIIVMFQTPRQQPRAASVIASEAGVWCLPAVDK